MSNEQVKNVFQLPQTPRLAKFGTKEFVCGCEFEIEAIKNYDNVSQQFSIVEDHSLRNNGREFKTFPSTYEDSLELFKDLHEKLIVGKEPFSDRTSIHVHVNVRDLELSEVRQMILIYALLEPLFFDFVGEKRKNSIFCVPLNYTFLPSAYKSSTLVLLEKWKNNKYTAFNILPINSFGTIEFRHLYGTNNKNVFSDWLSAIRELYTFIVKNPDFQLLRELSAERLKVSEFAMQVVPTLAAKVPGYYIDTITKDTLLDVKLASGGIR